LLFNCATFPIETALKVPFPRKSNAPLIFALVTRFVVMESTAIDNKLQLCNDKYKVLFGIVGKVPTGQKFNERYDELTGSETTVVKEILESNDIVKV
jgi:hypothetical protein